ncbi:hypothetical protein LO80_01785 [Candidatus Francisella endociliophora]|uniref:Uncharacterized protein n=1 Tax=Candidatus Francisella endociliophora TaxID=653937 RepID=A0A097EMN5_9GAMM|nr:hypothetical protein [Francisella sp. FSC1006]AIT08831.1 hypothetical protein LO80_01785 [Francisella sp. FSC1006]
MRKKSLFVFILLLVLTIVAAVLFYRFAEWYAQAMGEIFSYIVIISFSLFVFSPFKFMKDKKANISIVSYVKYLGISIFALAKVIANICKEVVTTVNYILKRFFMKTTPKKKELDQDSLNS